MVRVGKLHRDTYLYFTSSGDDDNLNGLLDNKIISWNGYWLRRIRLPAGSPVIAHSQKIYITVSGNKIVTITKILNKFFFKVSGSPSPWKLIVFPNGAPPYPYPISLISS